MVILKSKNNLGLNKTVVVEENKESKDSLRKLGEQSGRDRFNDHKKLFFRELQKDTLGKDSPGIVYDAYGTNDILNKHKQSYSFGSVRDNKSLILG